MRTKQTLVLMECIVMIMVFSLCAVICVKAFVWANETAQENKDLSMAMMAVQNAAEAVKGCSGDFAEAAECLGHRSCETESMTLCFNENWEAVCEEEAAFYITGQITDSGMDLLGQAELLATRQNGTELFSLTVCWQEAG